MLRPAGEEPAAASSSSREAPISNSQLSEAVTEQLLRAQQTQMQAPEEQVGAWLHGRCHDDHRIQGQHWPPGALHSSARPSLQRWAQPCPQAIPGSLDKIAHFIMQILDG